VIAFEIETPTFTDHLIGPCQMPTSVQVCDTCSAMVIDTRKHREWHGQFQHQIVIPDPIQKGST
jgi:hypothetical protein